MNIALEKTEEFVNGQKRRAYGDAFVRGNNGGPATMTTSSSIAKMHTVMYISADS